MAAVEESKQIETSAAAVHAKNVKRPNMLVTGTPGVGKTSLVSALCEETGFNLVDVNAIIKTQQFHEGTDKDRDCLIVDEDKLMDYVEESIINDGKHGGHIFDTHLCGCFDSTWFDLVIVLRCSNTALFDRLQERKYSIKKIQENVEAEIMQILYDEACETFDKKIVIQLQNDTSEQQESNIEQIKQWMAQFIQNQQKDDDKNTNNKSQTHKKQQ